MAERDIGLETLEGLQEIKAFKTGQLDLKTRILKDPSPPSKHPAKAQIVSSCFCRSLYFIRRCRIILR